MFFCFFVFFFFNWSTKTLDEYAEWNFKLSLNQDYFPKKEYIVLVLSTRMEEKCDADMTSDSEGTPDTGNHT